MQAAKPVITLPITVVVVFQAPTAHNWLSKRQRAKPHSIEICGICWDYYCMCIAGSKDIVFAVSAIFALKTAGK